MNATKISSGARLGVLVLIAQITFSAFGAAAPARPKQISLEETAKHYGIEIVIVKENLNVKTYHGQITAVPGAKADVDSFGVLFASEWNLYPVSLVKKSALKRVIFCTKLAFAGQARGAIPDFEHDDLYYDVNYGRYDETYVRRNIHHEFFHIIDYKDDGEVYSDPRWAALNSKSFKYGTGGKNAQDDANESVLTDKFPGFLDHYATAGVEEDKAEMFANMIVNSKIVRARVKKDPVLSAKAQRMTEVIKDFVPEVNQDFWIHAAELPRTAAAQK